MLPPRAPFNASGFIDGNVVSLPEKLFPAGRSGGRRKLVAHIDNAPAHNSRTAQIFFGHNQLRMPSHPLYSPNISPSDFYPFGTVKSTLIGQKIPDEIDFLEAVTEILNDNSDAELQCFFQS
jgi:hypothetical protein